MRRDEVNEELSDEELYDMYDEMLDECYGLVKICGINYQSSEALKEVDPTAYRVGFCDWLSAECDEGILEAFSNIDGMEAYRYAK